MSRSKLGPIIRHIRLAKGIPQLEYAKLIGVTPSQMSKLEAGLNEPLESTTLSMLKILLPHVNIEHELLKAYMGDI